MAKPKTIRIRPFSLGQPSGKEGPNDPRLSIEIDGRILPLTKFVEIIGEIVPEKNSVWRRDSA